MLWKWFFSSELQIDFSNMKNYHYLLKIKSVSKINKTDIFQILSRMCNTISDINSILNSFLKIMSTLFTKTIIIFTQIFWNVFYYSKQFQTAHTMTLCKLEKSNYITFRIWKSIALLSMIEKTIEIVIMTYLKWMMKAHNMLSKQQMRKC